MTALKIKSLVKRYGKLVAVDNVSFEIEEGEIFALLGPNGAGKTTIISSITSLVNPTCGEIEIFGHTVEKEPRIAKSMVGCVPQELVNHGYFKLYDVLKFHMNYYGNRVDPTYIKYLMERLDLWIHRNKLVRELSGGMKRRILIAKALLHKPKLLLLDEPTAGVDIELKDTLWSFVKELKASGVSILLTTHNLEEAQNLCDRVGIIDHGKLLKVAPLSDMLSNLSKRSISIQLECQIPAIVHQYLQTQENNQLVFAVPSTFSLKQLLAEIDLDVGTIKDVHIREGNLEDVFRNVLSS
ncbi:MAG: ABC transporter ATP-binding protein [Simkaniaceae bacterium]|nr:ABC transporter ATP-binding protein [Simkaniaceae bacterium]